jgi:hypothetical protein
MKSRASSIDDLNERLRSIQQRIANAKIEGRVLSAQMKTLSLEITELEACAAALRRALEGRVLSNVAERRSRVC